MKDILDFDLNEPIPIQFDIDCCEERIAALKSEVSSLIADLYSSQRELEREEERLEDLLAVRDG